MALGFGSTSYAFHDGGVAYCDGCHTMHNSSGGAVMNARSGQGSQTIGTANGYLLQGSDQSSTCLKCHSGSTAGSYKIATYPVPGAGSPPLQLTPGGDFSWVQKDYTWTSPRSGSSPKDRHGHNINAADFGFTTDATLATAPGGSYAANQLHCSSCHDPHGKYRIMDAAGTTIATTGKPIHASGSYGEAPNANEAVGVFRLLGGVGYAPASYNSVPFTNGSPIAVAPSSYNRAEDTTDTRVAYGQGMSEWCANCHSAFHNDSYPGNLRHPAGNSAKLTAAVISNYNTYKKSGDMGGATATAYTSMVPFEAGTTDLATLAALTSSTAGADTSSNVSCLSCHRAHATGFKSMTRWNNAAEFLTVAGDYANYVAGSTNEAEYGTYSDGKSKSEYQKAMYDRPATQYASFQRSLCNKCHAKD